MTVIEGKDLAKMDIGGKSDPFVVVTFEDQISRKDYSVKSLTVQKNLNPSWMYACHSWILHFPFTVKVFIYDEDVVSNDFMGFYEFTINSQDDVAFDGWVDLVARPGKKDKKVQGQIHLQWNARFMKNLVINPATEWPDYALISIEPVPVSNVIEIMGPIDDLVMLSCLSDCKIRRLPSKMFHKMNQREALGWEIKVCSPGLNYMFSQYLDKWKWDFIQNLCLRLLNRFANYGFMLLRGDLMDVTLWMVRTRTSANVVNQTTFVLVEPFDAGVCESVTRVEVQGDISPMFLAPILKDFNFIQVLDPYREHMIFSVYTKRHKIGLTHDQNKARKNENASQNLTLAVMDSLHQSGFIHQTPWGNAHLFIRSNEWSAVGTTAVTGRVGSYAVVDPFRVLRGASPRIEVQGLFDEGVLSQVAQAVSSTREGQVEFIKEVDLDIVSNYQFKLNKSALSGETMKADNIFQNLLMDVASKLGSFGGYEVVDTFGRDCLMLQRTILPSHLPPDARFKYLLVDPCTQTLPLRFELQGDLTVDQVSGAAAFVGCKEIFEEKSKRFGRTAWVIPVAKTTGMTWSIDEMRRKMNKLQYYGMRLISYFHNCHGYEAITQYAGDAFLCRIRSPQELQRGQYILIDTLMVGKIRIEITGDISIEEVAAAAQTAQIPAPQPIIDKKDNDMVLGYSIETDYFAVSNPKIPMDQRRQIANLWQHVWIKFFNRLSAFGWQYKFPCNNGMDRGSVFFRPSTQ
eukprot:TRINITY_DN11481_c0_g1_i1.p1 TRINITY_DN11481_c0_g1~~TRINITY_DN11481_c0_g1_i1.p1  ORF type:complete len:782 (+),score=107.53 TRINITY_DN11481_c0_g1_i1:123-2348(+)